MNIEIVDAKCPICGSDQCRSKVGDENNVWWYICDNPDCSSMFVVDRKLTKIKPRFYFTMPHEYKYVMIEYVDLEDNTCYMAYRKNRKWYKVVN